MKQGAPSDAVEATFLEFEHNYNARSREKMYLHVYSGEYGYITKASM